MSYLLDTVTVSEWVKPSPDPGVVSWLDKVDEDRTYLSVLTIGELRRGVDRLAPGRRQDQLTAWLVDELPERFQGRVLPVDESVAHAWGRLTARLQGSGQPIGSADTLIAATAECYALQVVTRNVSDFESAGVAVINPWSG